MLTPYDWQEGMRHRQDYVRSRLASGSPVFMISRKDGILAYALRRQSSKVYEIYDRLMMGAIGQQSDIEAMRVAAIDYAHQEGYNRSEDDVTIGRVVGALSVPMKRAFADFNTAPFVGQALFAEVCQAPDRDSYYLLDYDGDYSIHRNTAFLAGSAEATQIAYDGLKQMDPEQSIEKLKKELRQLWLKCIGSNEEGDETEVLSNLTEEVILLVREPESESRFISL